MSGCEPQLEVPQISVGALTGFGQLLIQAGGDLAPLTQEVPGTDVIAGAQVAIVLLPALEGAELLSAVGLGAALIGLPFPPGA